MTQGVIHRTLEESFTGIQVGAAVNVTLSAVKHFAMQVVGVGGTAPLWDVRLEGSLDGVNFTEILQHNNTIGNGAVLWSGTDIYPCSFFRARVVSLTLGPTSALKVYLLGMV